MIPMRYLPKFFFFLVLSIFLLLGMKSLDLELLERIEKLEQKWQKQAFPPVGEGYLTPQMYGAVADDAGLDTEAFQKLFQEAALRNQNVYVPPGEYRIDTTITFRPAYEKNRKRLFHFTGYGANIVHTRRSGGYAFYFIRTKEEYYLNVEGFRFVGSAQLDVNGLRVEGITQSTFRNMHFARLDHSFDFAVGWNNIIENMTFVNTGRTAFRGMALSGGGCKKGYNVNTHTNFRVHGGNWTWKKFKQVPESHFHLAGAGNIFQDFTTEGLRARYAFVIDESGNCMNVNTVRNVHEEAHAWSEVTDGNYYSLYIPELRHQFDLYWMPQHGIKAGKDKLGQIIIHDSGLGGHLVSDKTGEPTVHAIPRMTGISRGLHIYAYAHKGLTQEKYETIVKCLGRENQSPGKLRYRIVCNGVLWYDPVSI